MFSALEFLTVLVKQVLISLELVKVNDWRLRLAAGG
jgi:hypothetical protein